SSPRRSGSTSPARRAARRTDRVPPGFPKRFCARPLLVRARSPGRAAHRPARGGKAGTLRHPDPYRRHTRMGSGRVETPARGRAAAPGRRVQRGGTDPRTGVSRGMNMAWWIAFIVAGLGAFLFDAQIAQHIPLSDLTVRQVLIGSLIGLAAGFGIHVFERPPR